MSLQSKYKTLKIYEKVTSTSASVPNSYKLIRTFKGLIQNAPPSTTYNNGQSTSTVNAILFCNPKETFATKDLIENINGVRYKIANSDLQANGVTGIAGHHAEYNLAYIQGVSP